MPSPRPYWVYDPVSQRYRNLRNGRYIDQDELRSLRNEFAEALREETDRIAQRLFDGVSSIQDWVLEMRTLIKDAYIAQYAASIGGMQYMTQSDYGRIGAMLSSQNRGQYWYLQQFAEAIARGELSEAQIRARAALYGYSSVQAFERGKARLYGLTLPAYPGDGTTACLSNCKCGWRIRETNLAYYCTWTLGIAEHCSDCVDRAGMWSPLVLLKGFAVNSIRSVVDDAFVQGLEWYAERWRSAH